MLGFLFWCCLAPFSFWVAATVAMYLEQDEFTALLFFGIIAGLGAPPYYSTRIAAHSNPKVRRRWIPVIIIGWLANAGILAGMIGCAILLQLRS
ncbi:MAG: hypothetical protein KF902_11390 [Phycisphaeraceae bacterium]|nr:hypothetical protein [Phycisphaeraceae bacterium]MCW5767390.1 hypothetical protein [Phycisphaeraceae bacterium]